MLTFQASEYQRYFALLHNLSFNNETSKARMSSSPSISYSIISDWSFIKSDEYLLMNLMKYLNTLACQGNEGKLPLLMLFGLLFARLPLLQQL